MGRVDFEALRSREESLPPKNLPKSDAFEDSKEEWSFESLRLCRAEEEVEPFIRGVERRRGEGGSPTLGEGGGNRSDLVVE